MNRDRMLARLGDLSDRWDVVVIGGGATGLGTALEAAARGYSTVLLEQSDFAKGTSSRSTKLIHGGLRYLRQGNIALVLDSLRERGLLMRNAPHLVRNQSFVVPSYDWWSGPFYGIGLKLYDMLAGRLGLGPSRMLSLEETLERIPTLERAGLRGGVIYHDGQFDDARLAVTLARTLADRGGVPINYAPVTGLMRHAGMVTGVRARDLESGRDFELAARVVINATGVFCDAVRRMDDPASAPLVVLSQGVHIVLDRAFQPGESAIMVPQTDDGRVLFAVPWHDRLVVGTTDTPVQEATLEPRPQEAEIDFLLAHAARYLTRDPRRDDILSLFAGLRPLVRNGDVQRTASMSRDHTVQIAPSGLVTVTGGKWTTYRRMGEETVDGAAVVGGLPERDSPTRDLRLHGFTESAVPAAADLGLYGSESAAVRRLAEEDPSLREPLHARLPYLRAEVVWGARHEMARGVEDVLARRTRALLLDARASIEAAPRVAALLAAELGRDAAWCDQQVRDFTDVARGYLP